MSHTPSWLKPVAVVVAVTIVGILLAGIFTVPYRSLVAPSGYNQSRVHWNTKNTTRFDGADLAEVSVLVSRAVYPAIDPATTPDVVILYDPEDWQGGLAAAPLLRPLNAILLPATPDAFDDIGRLAPVGSDALGGTQVLGINDADLPEGYNARAATPAEVFDLLGAAERSPRHAILVPEDEPSVALLAAPWAAYTNDLVVFDAADVPEGIQVYALGDVEAEGEVTRITAPSAAQLAVKFATYEDPANPLFGWGFNADSLTGYRAYTLARPDDPAMALLSANLNVRGKPGPLMWSGEDRLPQPINNYFWTQRAAFWVTPSEGPFHHFFVLGDTNTITFPAQGQADYAVEIGPYLGKGAGLSGIGMVAAVWVALGIASAGWILFHEAKFLPMQNWVMRLAWPLFALMVGPFGIPIYRLAYSRPVIKRKKMMMWDRPLWLQGAVATVSAVGFGASLMIVSGYITTLLGVPLIPNNGLLFFLGAPMILIMIINYVVAVIISWLVFQTPMMTMFYDKDYSGTLPLALPIVLISMGAAALGMNPAMWLLMMDHIPMMPTEESILWFGTMFVTAFAAFLIAWPFNYALMRAQRKPGLM